MTKKPRIRRHSNCFDHLRLCLLLLVWLFYLHGWLEVNNILYRVCFMVGWFLPVLDVDRIDFQGVVG